MKKPYLVIALALIVAPCAPSAHAQAPPAAATPAVSEQAAPPATPQPSESAEEASEQRVEVTLEFDPKDDKNPIAIKMPVPEPVLLSKMKKQKAHWYLNAPGVNATLEIKMKKSLDPRPFAQHPKNNGKDSVSGPPDKGKAGDSYAYRVRVFVKSPKKTLKLDPIIKITP